MIIAIDIDNTCITNDSFLYKVFDKTQRVISLGCKTPVKLCKNIKYKPTILNKFVGIFNSKKYYQINDAAKVIKELKKEHTIIMLSSRPYAIKEMRYLTQRNLADEGIEPDAVFLNCSDKAQFCKDFKVNILIDDNIRHCRQTNQLENTKTIWFNSKSYNEHNVYTVDKWNEVAQCIELIKIDLVRNKNYLSDKFVNDLQENFKMLNLINPKLNVVLDYTRLKTVKQFNQLVEDMQNCFAK